MRRAVAVVLAIALSFAVPSGAALAGARVNRCDTGRPAHIVRCIARTFNAPGTPRYAVSIARCESGLTPRATSPDGSYRGLFQQSVRYWDGRYAHYARRFDVRASIYEPVTNALVSVRMARAVGTWHRDWVGCS